MITAEALHGAIAGYLAEKGLFLVNIEISKDNDITIAIESSEGDVKIENCVDIDHIVAGVFDRDVEDYSLTVTSAGLDQPFKVLKQYQKAVGKKVEVMLKGGKKMVALLEAADEESVTLKYSVKEAVEGKKKKELVEHVDRFTMDQVNAVRPFIEFN